MSGEQFGALSRFVRAKSAHDHCHARGIALGIKKQSANTTQHHRVKRYPIDTAQVFLNTFCACFGLFGIEIGTFQRKQLKTQRQLRHSMSTPALMMRNSHTCWQ